MTIAELRALVSTPGVVYQGGYPIFQGSYNGDRGESTIMQLFNAKNYLNFLDSGRNTNNMSYDDFVRLGVNNTLAEIYNGRSSGQSPFPGAPPAPAVGTPLPFTPAPPSYFAPPPPAPPAPGVGGGSTGGGSTGGGTSGGVREGAIVPGAPPAYTFPNNGGYFAPPYTGGNTGGGSGGSSGLPSVPSVLGTAPQQMPGVPWKLSGSFGGTFMPFNGLRGVNNFNPNDFRALNAGAVPFSGGGGTTSVGSSGSSGSGGGSNKALGGSGAPNQFTPRPYLDMYGTGLSVPWNNNYQQWGLSMLNQPVMPTYDWAKPRAPAPAPSLFGGLGGLLNATPVGKR